MKIKEWLLDNGKRQRCICLIYRLILKKSPFDSDCVRQQLEKFRYSDNIIYIWNQFDTLRAYYRLLLKQNTFANQVKLIRLIHQNTIFHNKSELVAIQRLKKEKQYKQMKENDKQFLENLLKKSIKDNNDQNRQRYPTLLDYINDKNSEKYDQKYTPSLSRQIICQNKEYQQAYEYLYDKDQQKQSIKRM